MIQLKSRGEKNWLLIKTNDKYAEKKIKSQDFSARSGKSMEEIGNGPQNSKEINKLIEQWGGEKKGCLKI